MTTAPVLFQNMPPLTPEEYTALEASILEHGILSPVITDEAGVILDGHHRSKIASEHSLSCPKQIVYGKTDTEKRTMALSLNLDRRHLNREQKRALVAESVKADPQLSDREHARRSGASDKTVGTVRRELVANAEIPHSVERVTADGKPAPGVKPAAPESVNTDTGEIAEERKPKAEAITSQFNSVVVDLNRLMDRLHRITEQDAYARNADKVSTLYRADLERAAADINNILNNL